MKPYVEIEEWYKDGIVVRRYANGVEIAADDRPSAIQFCESVVTRKYMTKQEFNHYYPNLKS